TLHRRFRHLVLAPAESEEEVLQHILRGTGRAGRAEVGEELAVWIPEGEPPSKFVGESALAHPCLTVDEKQHRTSGCDGKVTPPMATAPCLAHLTLLVVSREKLLYVVFPATKQPVAGGQRGSGASPPPRPPACPLVVWRFLGGRRRGNPRRGGRPEGVAS